MDNVTYRTVSQKSSYDGYPDGFAGQKVHPPLSSPLFLTDLFCHSSLYGSLKKQKMSIEICKIVKKKKRKKKSLSVHRSVLRVTPGSAGPSKACHNFYVQATSSTWPCPRNLSLVWSVAQLDVMEAVVEAGTQQIGGVSGSQRNQWTSTIQRQRR